MDRRKALMQMGMSMGYIIAAPTFMGIVQGCQGDQKELWTPEFLSQDQGSVLKELVDAILPKTDTKSASEINVHVFLDSFANEVMEKKQQDQFTSTLDQLAGKALKASGKSKASDLNAEDLAPVMLATLKAEGKKELPYATKIRDLTIWGYKCTEYVGEEVLAYLPVPGEYVPCGDLNELTGAKAWSL